MKRFTCLIIVLTMLFLSSCGIPSFLTCRVDHNENAGNHTITISDIRINGTEIGGLLTSSLVSAYSPSITFFYTITNSNSEISQLRNAFNNQYSSETGRPKSANIDENSEEYIIAFNSSSDINYKLYFLKENGNKPLSPAGHINKTLINSVLSPSFKIEENKITDNEYTVDIKYKDPNNIDKTLSLLRFNGSNFKAAKPQTGNEDYSAISDSDSVYVHIYCAVNIIGSDSATFSNRYWSDLEYITTFVLD